MKIKIKPYAQTGKNFKSLTIVAKNLLIRAKLLCMKYIVLKISFLAKNVAN
jgi:hypothetical protein